MRQHGSHFIILQTHYRPACQIDPNRELKQEQRRAATGIRASLERGGQSCLESRQVFGLKHSRWPAKNSYSLVPMTAVDEHYIYAGTSSEENDIIASHLSLLDKPRTILTLRFYHVRFIIESSSKGSKC